MLAEVERRLRASVQRLRPRQPRCYQVLLMAEIAAFIPQPAARGVR